MEVVAIVAIVALAAIALGVPFRLASQWLSAETDREK